MLATYWNLCLIHSYYFPWNQISSSTMGNHSGGSVPLGGWNMWLSSCNLHSVMSILKGYDLDLLYKLLCDILSGESFFPYCLSPIWTCCRHGIIIRTGIACQKIPCYMRDSACRWFIVENANIFRIYVEHFWIFPRERNCRILIGLCKEVLMNHPIMLLDRDNKGKLVPASFSYFLELLWEKNEF